MEFHKIIHQCYLQSKNYSNCVFASENCGFAYSKGQQDENSPLVICCIAMEAMEHLVR